MGREGRNQAPVALSIGPDRLCLVPRSPGRRIEVDGRTIVPIARSLRLPVPGGAGGLVWNRPVGILVEEAGGRRYVRVRDRTREIQWLLLGAGLAVAVVIWLAGRRPARRGLRWR